MSLFWIPDIEWSNLNLCFRLQIIVNLILSHFDSLYYWMLSRFRLFYILSLEFRLSWSIPFTLEWNDWILSYYLWYSFSLIEWRFKELFFQLLFFLFILNYGMIDFFLFDYLSFYSIPYQWVEIFHGIFERYLFYLY